MHEFFILSFTWHNFFGKIFYCSNCCFWLLLSLIPTITFLMVRCLVFRSFPISYPESPGFFANDTLTCTLEVRKDFIAFCERSFERTIADILRRNSSNAFVFRSAALGKSCVLHIEYFKESAWLTYDRVAEV